MEGKYQQSGIDSYAMAGARRPEAMSRRDFLSHTIVGGFLALAAAIIYPIIRFVLPPKVPEAGAGTVVAARKDELAPNSGKIFRFGDKPGILVHLSNGEYRAFSAVCTHLDCTVQYRTDLGHIWCACHNGHYDLTGKNIAGPPPAPLTAFKVTFRGDEIIVSKSTA